MKKSKKADAAYEARLKDYHATLSNPATSETTKRMMHKPGSRNPRKVK